MPTLSFVNFPLGHFDWRGVYIRVATFFKKRGRKPGHLRREKSGTARTSRWRMRCLAGACSTRMECKFSFPSHIRAISVAPRQALFAHYSLRIKFLLGIPLAGVAEALFTRAAPKEMSGASLCCVLECRDVNQWRGVVHSEERSMLKADPDRLLWCHHDLRILCVTCLP